MHLHYQALGGLREPWVAFGSSLAPLSGLGQPLTQSVSGHFGQLTGQTTPVAPGTLQGPWGPTVPALPAQWMDPQAGGNLQAPVGAYGQQGVQCPGLGMYGFPLGISLAYEVTPAIVFPTGDVERFCGKEKILWREFVGIFSLLFHELEKKDKEDLDEKDKEKLKKRKLDRTSANWLPGFFIYVSLISCAQPWRATALWQ